MTSSPRPSGDGEGLSHEMVRAAQNGARSVYGNHADVISKAEMCAALVAAGVPDLIAERDRLREENVRLLWLARAVSEANDHAVTHYREARDDGDREGGSYWAGATDMLRPLAYDARALHLPDNTED